MKKHRILQQLKGNKDIVILRPDKGNGVVVLNRTDYDRLMLEIISDQSKFIKTDEWTGKEKKSNITKFREDRLQRYLRKLKNDGLFDDVIYEKIYPKGSQPARIYGLPKIHKIKGDVTGCLANFASHFRGF